MTPVIAGLVLLAMKYVDNPTPEKMRKCLQDMCIDLGAVGKDNRTGYGLPTFNAKAFENVRSQIFGWNENDISWRALEIKSLMVEKNLSQEEAESMVNPNYHIIGYEIIEGKNVPIYGGRRW